MAQGDYNYEDDYFLNGDSMFSDCLYNLFIDCTSLYHS